MKKENDQRQNIILYVLIGLFVVVVLYLTVMGLSLLNSTEPKGAPNTIPEITRTIPGVTN